MKFENGLSLILLTLLLACSRTPVTNSVQNHFCHQTDSLFRQAASRQQAQDFSGAISLYKQLLQLRPPTAQVEQQILPLVKEALLQLMYCHFFSGQRADALTYYQQLYADTSHWFRQHYPRNVEICLGYTLYENARLPEAVRLISQALTRPENSVPMDELYVDYGIAGAIYNQTGDIHEAIRCSEKCAALLRKLDNQTDLINALSNLIYQYQQIGNFRQSLTAYEELIQLKEVQDNPYLRCIAEVNIISLFDEWGLEEEVDKHLQEARKLAYTCGIPEALLRVKNLETSLLLEKEEIKAATLAVDSLEMLLPDQEEGSFYRIYYQDFRLITDLLNTPACPLLKEKATKRLLEVRTQPMNRIYCDISYYLGKALEKKEYIFQAIQAYEGCIPYIRENQLLNLQRKVYRALARLYSRQADYATAIRYHEQYESANQAFTERRNAALMSRFRVKYETREKEQANQLLQAEVQLQKRNMQYYSVLGMTTLLLVVLSLIWALLRHRTLRLQHEKDAQQHELDILRQQEAERVIREQERRLREMLQERLDMNRKNEELRIKIEQSGTEQQLHNLMASLSPRLLTQEEEKLFRQQFTRIHPSFLSQLRKNGIRLSHSEELLAMLIRLNLNNEEVAFALGINRNSVNTSRSRLRKKLALSSHESLDKFIQNFK